MSFLLGSIVSPKIYEEPSMHKIRHTQPLSRIQTKKDYPFNHSEVIEMKLNEVSEIEIKTFSVENLKEFWGLELHEKLKRLEDGEEKFSVTRRAIGLGDAFQTAMNTMFSCKGEIAPITETRVITLDKTICTENSQ
jgi:hypothetical protein